jgi:hypothetical protein
MILVVLLAACGTSSAASEGSATSATTHRPDTCGPRAARTLAAGAQARIYLSNGEVYGCAVGAGHSYRLGTGRPLIREGRVGVIAVAGRYAAYGLSSFGVDMVSARVIVRNLANGAFVHDAPATTRILVESFQSVDSIVVKPDGATAWIAAVASVVSRNRYLEVHRVDARGTALLYSRPGIVSRSLTLHGSTVTWRNGSTSRSATLR